MGRGGGSKGKTFKGSMKLNTGISRAKPLWEEEQHIHKNINVLCSHMIYTILDSCRVCWSAGKGMEIILSTTFLDLVKVW